MNLAFWRDVAVVLLAIEAFVLGLVPLVLLYLGARGVKWLNRNIPTYSEQARRAWQRVDERVNQVSARVRRPLELTRRFASLFTHRDTFGRELDG